MTQQNPKPSIEFIPAVWVQPAAADQPYVVHSVVAPDAQPGKADTYQFRTTCDQFAVPTEQALFYNSHHRTNCTSCRQREQEGNVWDEARARDWIDVCFPNIKRP